MRRYSFFSLILAILVMQLGVASRVSAQSVLQNVIQSSDSKHVFAEDSKAKRKSTKKEVKTVLVGEAAPGNLIDFRAPQVEFEKEKNTLVGKGGVLISSAGVQIEADKGQFNRDTKEARVAGHVVFTDVRGSIAADQASLNVEDETGTFLDSRFKVEDGNYNFDSARVDKISEKKYHLFDTKISTCDCADDSQPWVLNGSECNITQEGYAHVYGATLDMYGVPIFYSPYFGFPAKTERTSGLLSATAGYSRKHGLIYRQPIFIVLNDTADTTLTPFMETKSRYGSFLDYRENFSRYNKFKFRFLYSDESPRNGDLQGTIPTGYFDPTFDKNRFAFSESQQWTNSPHSANRFGLYSDIHYISDDLTLREIDGNGIGDRQLPYLTSLVTARANIGDYLAGEVTGEYDQSITSDQKVQMQRLPEISLTGMRSFRPFGFNPYGIKLVTRADVGATDFVREKGYDGWRTTVTPAIGVPFHFENYFYSLAQFSFNHLMYNLDERQTVDEKTTFPGSTNSDVYQFKYTISTALERVYQLDEGNWLSYLTSMGSKNQDVLLKRVKNVIEPIVSYTYVPKIDTKDVPIFDSSDRPLPHSQVNFALNTSLLGRFEPRRGGDSSVLELLPRVEDLPTIDTTRALEDIGTLDDGTPFSGVRLDRGQIRELASFTVKKSFDQKAADAQGTPNRPWSDLGSILGLYPTKDFGLYVENNYNQYTHQVSSWSLASSITDDRQDALRARFTYVRNALSQLEGNVEVPIVERIRIGGYTRYDNIKQEFIENYAALRLASSCNCWHFDVGFRETVNPDKQAVLFTFTFTGLGDLGGSNTVYRGSAAAP